MIRGPGGRRVEWGQDDDRIQVMLLEQLWQSHGLNGGGEPAAIVSSSFVFLACSC